MTGEPLACLSVCLSLPDHQMSHQTSPSKIAATIKPTDLLLSSFTETSPLSLTDTRTETAPLRWCAAATAGRERGGGGGGRGGVMAHRQAAGFQHRVWRGQLHPISFALLKHVTIPLHSPPPSSICETWRRTRRPTDRPGARRNGRGRKG